MSDASFLGWCVPDRNRLRARGADLNIEWASYVGLVGTGLSIAAFFGLTAVGILFVRLLDGIEGYCHRVGVRWNKTKAIVSGSESASAVLPRRRTRELRRTVHRSLGGEIGTWAQRPPRRAEDG
jgi:hypothetical protein